MRALHPYVDGAAQAGERVAGAVVVEREGLDLRCDGAVLDAGVGEALALAGQRLYDHLVPSRLELEHEVHGGVEVPAGGRRVDQDSAHGPSKTDVTRRRITASVSARERPRSRRSSFQT